MSESVHAVVAKPTSASSQHHQQDDYGSTTNQRKVSSSGTTSQLAVNYNNSQTMQNNNNNDGISTTTTADVPEDDDDDDIDIIGKFGQHTQGNQIHGTNQSLFVITAASSSIGSNSYHNLSNSQHHQFATITSPPVNRLSTFLPTEFNVPTTPTFSSRSNNVFNDSSLEPQSPFAPLSSRTLPPHLGNNNNNNIPYNNNSKDNSNQTKQSSSTDTTASTRQPFRATVANESSQQPQQQLQSHSEWTSDTSLIPSRDRLRRSLRYHFMSPFDKWKIKGRFPWKLLFQVIKIIMVTTQVILFGNSVTRYQAIDNSMILSLHNLFLLNWDSSHDFETVPPVSGPYAVYTKDDVYQHIDFAIKNYANISALSIGSFGYQLEPEANRNPNPVVEQLMSPIELCFRRYINATLNPSQKEYFVDLTEYENCVYIRDLYPPGSPLWSNFTIFDYLTTKLNTNGIDFESLLSLSLKFPMRTILLNTPSTYNTPQCYDLDLSIHFNNKAHSGEISIYMKHFNRQIKCNGNSDDHSRVEHSYNVYLAVNFIVLFLCLFSFVLCIRSLWRAQSLRRRTSRFFAVAYKRNLDTQSSVHFIDGWILMILLNDCLLITATTINLFLQFTILNVNHINIIHPVDFNRLCSALLGVGNLLVWCGILRYLAFFSKYNILIVTLKHSIPRVLRFLLCVLVLYGGFCFSGWIILGPYHYKFQTLARTSECLFALMNGDDVFATFAYLQHGSLFVWWFSRLYLYTFVLLFIYVVLSLFIAILMDSYETVKDYYLRRNLKGFFDDNDILSRFILSDDQNLDEDDTLSNFRLNLLNDEEVEYRQNHHHSHNHRNIASANSSPTSLSDDQHSIICHCCACHCSRCPNPFTWIQTFYRYCRDRFSNTMSQQQQQQSTQHRNNRLPNNRTDDTEETARLNHNYRDSSNLLPIN